MRARNNTVSFFGLGGPTAATALYSYIAEHPQACLLCTGSNFFGDVKQFAKGIAWYEGQFNVCPPGSVQGELSQNYLLSGQAAALIAKTYPSARLLAIIQNPLVSVRVEYIEARQRQKIAPTVTLASFLKQNPEVLLRAKFGRQLVPYFSYYSHTDLLVLLEEDLAEDTLKNLAAVYTHLGFTMPFVPVSLRHLIVAEEEEIKKRPGFIKRGFRALKSGIKFLYLKVKSLVKRKVVVKESVISLAKKVPISPELEDYLHDYYRADVRQLSDLLRRNVDVEWGFTADKV